MLGGLGLAWPQAGSKQGTTGPEAKAASQSPAASGTMTFWVRDVHSHYSLPAVIKGEGPKSFSVTTDAKGRGKIDLPAGEYRLEISASGHASLRTHYLVEPGKTTKAGAFLEWLTVPEEESTEVLEPLVRAGYTLLHEYVVDADTGEPLSGVKVRFVNAGVETETDSKGHFCLSVATPEPENPGGIGTDTLMYEKPGYKTIILRNFGIDDDEMGPVAIDMRKGKGVIDEDATHRLMRKESDNQGGAVLAAGSGTLELRVRDVVTGYDVRATIKLQGPETLALQTDDEGHLTREIPAGAYQVLVTASGYKVRKARLGIGTGTLNYTVIMDPELLPEEERPDAIQSRMRPGYTLFHGYVEDDDTGKPLPGVTVRFVNAGVETETDSKGHFFLSVPTPEPENPDWMGTDTLIYQKSGYKTVILENFGVASEAMGPTGVALEKGKGVIKTDATHKLMRKEGARPEEEPQSAAPGGMSLSPELWQWLGGPGSAFSASATTNLAAAQ